MILSAAVLSTLSFGSACMPYYKTVSPSVIDGMKPINSPKEKVEKIDYSNLTWQEAIDYVKTPEQAQEYLRWHFEYDLDEYNGFSLFPLFNIKTKGETFRHNHTRRKGICIDYATAAAALLSDDGYPPLLLYIKKEKLGSSHVVFLYKADTGFGALGSTPEKPVHEKIEDLVKNISKEYNYYAIVNLDENYKNREWIDGDIDMQGSRKDNWIEIKEQPIPS